MAMHLSFEDLEEIKKLTAIRTLVENFGKEMSDDLQNAWLDLLAGYPSGRVEAAVRAVIENYEYKTIPPFAVLKKQLSQVDGTSEEALQLQAVSEFNFVLCEIGRAGSYKTPRLEPTTAFVVRQMGGWEDVCRWEREKLDFKRKDFIDLWKDAYGRVDEMRLGAGAVRQMLGTGQDRFGGPKAIQAGVSRALGILAGEEGVQ